MKIKPLYLLLIVLSVACQVVSVVVLKVMTSECLIGFISPAVIISGMLLVSRACMWQYVLKGVELSVANSFNAITPCLVLLVGWWVVGEQVSLANLMGGMIIAVGVVIVSMSEGSVNRI